MERQISIGVLGGRIIDSEMEKIAEEVGIEIANRGAILVCGGMGGVMEFACKGAKSAGGTTIGILPTASKDEANKFVDISIATGLGSARNSIILRSVDAAIAVDGKYGTLSEIAYAMEIGVPIIGIKSWDIDGVIKAGSASEAVNIAFEKL